MSPVIEICRLKIYPSAMMQGVGIFTCYFKRQLPGSEPSRTKRSVRTHEGPNRIRG